MGAQTWDSWAGTYRRLSRWALCLAPLACSGMEEQARETVAHSAERLSYGSNQYQVNTTPKSFAEAASDCAGKGAHVIRVDSAGKDLFLRTQLPGTSWIDAVSPEGDGTWVWSTTNQPIWSDGAPAPGSYFNFRAPGPTADSHRTCAIARGGQWDHSNCGAQLPYVCEFDTPPGAATAPDTNCTAGTKDGHSYWFCKQARTFGDAQTHCHGVGMELTTIDTAAENDFVKQSVNNDSYIGLTSAAEEGAFRWIAGGQLDMCAGAAHAEEGQFESFPNGQPHSQPGSHDCVMVNHGGVWTQGQCTTPKGYVCESLDNDAFLSLDQVAATIRDDYHDGKPLVSDVVFRANTNVRAPFGRYQARLGLRSCADRIVASGTPTTLPSASEAANYVQLYQGVPVQGRGYVVKRSPSSKVISSFTGRAAHDVSVATKPVLSQSEALAKALSALKIPSGASAPKPTGNLLLYPKRQGKFPVWELAYTFLIPKGTTRPARNVAVSALTGAVLNNQTVKREQCASIDVTNQFLSTEELEVSTYQHNLFLDPDQAFASKIVSNPPVATPYPLLASALTNDKASPQYNHPRLYTTCEFESYPKITALDQQSIVVDNTSSDAYQGAAFQMAVQRCIEYFAQSLELKPGTPWLGLNGTGQEDVKIQLFHPTLDLDTGLLSSPLPYYADDAIHYSPSVPYFLGANLEVACHEFLHAVWDHVSNVDSGESQEMRSVEEGVANVFGNASEMFVRGYPGKTSWCYGGDEHENDPVNTPYTCLDDFKDPHKSEVFNCVVRSANGNVLLPECPAEYEGPDYCADLPPCDRDLGITRDCCDSHRNATIISHWSYIVANGKKAANASCPYDVPAMDDDLATSMRDIANTVLYALSDQRLEPLSGFPGFADATISAARDLFGSNSREAHAVQKGWFAVNVKEDLSDDDLEKLDPARSELSVYPWKRFIWPVTPDVTKWDIQISQGPFDQQPVLLDQTVDAYIPDSGDSIGFPIGFLSVALPENSGEKYYWRVRPHSSDPWADCFPIHMFIGTRTHDTMDQLKVLSPAVSKNHFHGGSLLVGWSPIEGADHYEVTASTKGGGCKADAGALTFNYSGGLGTDQELFAEYLSGFQPSTHYYLSVRAVGPKDFGGNPVSGECKTIELDTVELTPPVLLTPSDGANTFGFHPGTGFSIPLDPIWKLTGTDGATRYRITFTDINSSGGCTSHVALDFEGEFQGCYLGTCTATVDDLLFPHPNATGYCWSAVTIAANGEESKPSEQRRFMYMYTTLNRTQPGVQIASMTNDGNPAPLPGDSYCSDSHCEDVLFSWDPVADAQAYGIKLGRYPWNKPTPPDPSNCFIPSGTTVHTGCTNEPVEVFVNQVVDKSTGTLPGDKAGKGRYCWTSWPVVADPDDPTQPWSRQPLVENYPLFCYTSGPAEPTIECPDEPADGADFVDQDIHCTIHSDYVPDSQLTGEIQGTDSDQVEVDTTGCEADPESAPFADVYDCNIGVTIHPRAAQRVSIMMQAFNSDKHPPTTDETTLIHTAEHAFDTSACGKKGEDCCGSECKDDDLRCRGGKCESCGRTNGHCCDAEPFCGSEHNVCTFTAQNPADPVCIACGDVNQPCCDPDRDRDSPGICNSGGICDDSNDTFTGDVCTSCGGKLERCCDGTHCDSGLTCGYRPDHLWSLDCDSDVPECEGPNCGCDPLPGKPTLPAQLKKYVPYCEPNGTNISYDTDLSYEGCSISAGSIGQMVTQDQVECLTFLNFTWGQAANASKYIVYVREYPDGEVNRPPSPTNTAYADSTLRAPAGGEPRLFSVAVRGINNCNQKGPADLGMIAVRDDCL
jgi:Zn-dependent metalloprotease